MGRIGTTRFLPIAAAFGLAGAVCFSAAPPTPAPDKIDYSTSRDVVKLPDAAEGRDLSHAFEPLNRDNSMSGVVEALGGGPAPLPLPASGASSRMLELLSQRLDQKKNWIYAQPETLDDAPSAEEALQVRSFDSEGSTRKTDGLSDFFHERGQDSSSTGSSLLTLDRGRSDSPVLFDDKLDSSFRLESALLPPGSVGASKPGGGLGNPFAGSPLSGDPPSSPAAGASASENSILNPGTITGAANLSRVPTSIRDLLVTPGAINPLATDFDPINLRIDTTRQEVNPVTPRHVLDLPLEKRLDVAGSPGGPGGVLYDRSSPLQQMESRILGPSSLAPALSAPALVETPQAVSSKSTPLKLPTRRF